MANSNPKAIAINNAMKIFPVNDDIISEKKKKDENTIIEAHFVLANLNLPEYLSSLYKSLACMEPFEGKLDLLLI